MFKSYTVCFFGHRDFDRHIIYQDKVAEIIEDVLAKNDTVEFLVGRNGEFDRFVSTIIRDIKKRKGNQGIYHVLVLPYATSEYTGNMEYFEDYYDEIEKYAVQNLGMQKSQAYQIEYINIDNLSEEGFIGFVI